MAAAKPLDSATSLISQIALRVCFTPVFPSGGTAQRPKQGPGLSSVPSQTAPTRPWPWGGDALHIRPTWTDSKQRSRPTLRMTHSLSKQCCNPVPCSALQKGGGAAALRCTSNSVSKVQPENSWLTLPTGSWFTGWSCHRPQRQFRFHKKNTSQASRAGGGLAPLATRTPRGRRGGAAMVHGASDIQRGSHNPQASGFSRGGLHCTWPLAPRGGGACGSNINA